MSSQPHLISFKLCPFVQRSVITLLEKNVGYEITYIDLANKPDWFLEISPLGKVPVLKVNGNVLFESAVINEYLDEVHPPSFHPADPLRKAQNRAWIEYGSGLLMDQYRTFAAESEGDFQTALEKLKVGVQRLEEQVRGPLFNGDTFSLVDAALAPFFMRMDIIDAAHPLNLYEQLPRVKTWKDSLMARTSVQNSVVPELTELYHQFWKSKNSYVSRFF
ncbi:MAG: glutathione S-transferase family protein [Leptospiraceae bacterium]|nr:glutathione S-transferase family protein [Leptospiraceae bacterium]MCB1316478.1 glutathione S-transferase family protein [Leptospiraceae bacterium]MCB1320578.1 glutathione S-transferase family protein [Leptospiraceae bacterium]